MGLKISAKILQLKGIAKIKKMLKFCKYIGNYFGVQNDAIKEALESYIPENNRSQLITKGTNEIILDAYNANPSSMKVAIENFVFLDKKNKTLFLGDMFELGVESLQEHKQLVNSLSNQKDIICHFVVSFIFSNLFNCEIDGDWKLKKLNGR